MKFIVRCKLWQRMTPFLYCELTTRTGRRIRFIIHKHHPNFVITRNILTGGTMGTIFEFIVGKYSQKTVYNFLHPEHYQNPTI